jgi:hypothetical protein
MRKLSPLVGLTLIALAGQARAQAAAPAAATPPAGEAAAATAPLEPPAAKTPPLIPAPTTAPAGVAAATPAAPVAARRKIEVGLSFLPMGLGKYTTSPNLVSTVTADASLAYGLGLSVGYEVIPHLLVGIAPQVLLNVGEKSPAMPTSASRQYDLMARVAYALTITEGTTVYAEVMPGYSIIGTPNQPKGFVVAFGLGSAIQMTERFFVNVGAGYQIGFQKYAQGANNYETRTRYLRVAVGGGVRF